jgi:membrane protein YqaA with SNARE-associated domain
MDVTTPDPNTCSMIRHRLPMAILASACGVASGIGGFFGWMNIRTAPRMDHTSLSRMLNYSLATDHTYLKSVGFVMLLLGVLMVLGGLSGLRVLTALGALLALLIAGIWIGLVAHHYTGSHLPNSYYANPLHLPWSKLQSAAWVTIGAASLGFLSTLIPRGWLRPVGQS